MGCGLLNNFKFSKKIHFFTRCTTRTRCVCSHRPDCEEDADEATGAEATGAESSSDEGEDAGPGEVHLEPHPPQTKILYETIHHKVAII